MRFADVTSLSLSCYEGDMGSVRASFCPGSRVSACLSLTNMDCTLRHWGQRGEQDSHHSPGTDQLAEERPPQRVKHTGLPWWRSG